MTSPNRLRVPDKPEPEANHAIERGRGRSRRGRTKLVHEPRGDLTSPRLPPKRKRRSARSRPNPSRVRDRNRRLREEAAGAPAQLARARSAIPIRNLEAGEIVDDALARSTQAAMERMAGRGTPTSCEWVVIAGLVGWVGYAIYSYRAGKAAELASAKLTTAIRAEDARLGSDDSKPDPQTGIGPKHAALGVSRLRRRLRLKAAENSSTAPSSDSWRLAVSTAATFAKLGLASVLYDQGKFADAKAAYQVRQGQQARRARHERPWPRARRYRHQRREPGQ